MTAYITRRLFTTLLIAIGISILVFLIVRTLPGDPARIMLGLQADESRIEALREDLGLDKPIFVQYGIWLSDVFHGNLGSSVITGQSVSGAILHRLPVTFSLALGALFVALLIAIPAGTIAAVKRDSYLASIITLLSQIGVGIPNFWLGIIFILIFAQWGQILPSFGYEPLSKQATIEPTIKDTLIALKGLGLKLGILSNTFVNAHSLEKHMKQLGLLDFFSVRMYSYQFDFRKPDLRIFKIAAERLGEPPENILYVGDRIDKDIEPALKVGFKPVLKAAYTNAGKTPPNGALKIDKVSELPALIKEINTKKGT